MAMHWTEIRAAQANLGKALRDLGWTLYDWHDDASNMQFDHYEPESWGGIAEKDGYICGVRLDKWQCERAEDKFKLPVHPTPRGRAWHLEHGGQIIATGVGLNRCSGYHDNGAHEIARKIDGYTQCLSTPAPLASSASLSGDGNGTVTVSINEAKNGVELRFPDKPPVEIRERLKAHGWRWSRFSRCWYTRRSDTALAFAQELAGAA